MTLFVSDSNYLIAVIGLVDCKWLVLERLHGWRNSQNREEGVNKITRAFEFFIDLEARFTIK